MRSRQRQQGDHRNGYPRADRRGAVLRFGDVRCEKRLLRRSMRKASLGSPAWGLPSLFPLMAAYRFFIEAIVLLVTMATGRCGLARCYGSGLSSHGYNAEDRGARDELPAQWLAPPGPLGQDSRAPARN